MHIRKTVAALAMLAVFGASASCAENEPKGYTCSFASGTASTFENGVFKSRAPEPIELTILDVDLERQSARLDGGAGKPAAGLKMVRAINANHFIEVVNEGFLNLTTIYDKDPVSGTYPAVHSRHFGVLGQPVVAQYAGTCTEK